MQFNNLVVGSICGNVGLAVNSCALIVERIALVVFHSIQCRINCRKYSFSCGKCIIEVNVTESESYFNVVKCRFN